MLMFNVSVVRHTPFDLLLFMSKIVIEQIAMLEYFKKTFIMFQLYLISAILLFWKLVLLSDGKYYARCYFL